MINKGLKRKHLSKQERLEVYNKCKGHCAYCGCELPFEKCKLTTLLPLI